MEKNIKRVPINEEALVELIYDITERTINERIDKGELIRPVNPGLEDKPKTTKKVKVTESQYKELMKAGKVISATKLVK